MIGCIKALKDGHKYAVSMGGSGGGGGINNLFAKLLLECVQRFVTCIN